MTDESVIVYGTSRYPSLARRLCYPQDAVSFPTPREKTMNISRFWWFWMLTVCIGTGVFGLAFVLLPEAMIRLFDALLFPGHGVDAAFGTKAGAYIRFVSGVLGAVMTGWSVMMVCWVAGPFRRGEPMGWIAVAASIVCWYVIDTPFSLLSGYAGNAIVNTLFLAAFAVPLAATAGQFWPRRAPLPVGLDESVPRPRKTA
jgi:hypothetical protein